MEFVEKTYAFFTGLTTTVLFGPDLFLVETRLDDVGSVFGSTLIGSILKVTFGDLAGDFLAAGFLVTFVGVTFRIGLVALVDVTFFGVTFGFAIFLLLLVSRLRGLNGKLYV